MKDFFTQRVATLRFSFNIFLNDIENGLDSLRSLNIDFIDFKIGNPAYIVCTLFQNRVTFINAFSVKF